jgi:hypothetical protein
MRESLEIISRESNGHITAEESLGIYEYLAAEIGESKHGNRFDVRPFDLTEAEDGRPSPLDAGVPYIVCNDDDPDTTEWLGNTVGGLIMPPKNFNALVQAFQEIYAEEKIVRFKKLGGSLMFMCNHLTYADLPVLSAASVIAKLNTGMEAPQETQDIIVHRLVGLFEHDLIRTVYDISEKKHRGGYILEDVLLPFSSVINTLPNSQSGYTKFVEKVKSGANLRKKVNTSAGAVPSKLVRLGGRDIFIAGSGQEMRFDKEDGKLHEAQIGRGTSDMLMRIAPNRVNTLEQVLTIPIYIHPEPFTGNKDSLLNPTPTPFVFLKPRVIRSPNDIHRTMLDIIEIGNEYKPSGVPQLAYNMPGPDWTHKSSNPDVWIAHSV